MLLTITTTYTPATDLGYLLHKNPARAHSFDLKFGSAHVVFPEASDERCTAALLVDMDALALSQRARRAGSGGPALLAQYVNDRPYAASSFLSVAMADVFGTAMAGRCKDRPELVDTPLPLSIAVHAVPASLEMAQRLFGPLGYSVTMAPSEKFTGTLLEPKRPAGVLTIEQEVPLRRALEHVYVLIPVMDNRKHYWVGPDEVTKLLGRAGSWLPSHPDRNLITRRYLRYSRGLTQDALERLEELESEAPAEDEDEEETPERPERLVDARVRAVTDALLRSGAKRVLDLGCGEGRLLSHLRRETRIPEIVGVDASSRALSRAARRLRLNESDPDSGRVRLIHGALTYADRRLKGFDAAVAMEALEHIDPDRLDSFERAVFEVAAPPTVILTTPNRDYNIVYTGIETGRLRHPDHRFEFTRSEFSEWCQRVASANGYTALISGAGEEHAEHGFPTQVAVFTK